MTTLQATPWPPRTSAGGEAARTVNLDELFARGAHHQVLALTLPQVEANPSQAALALAACKSLIALGLIDPALEIVQRPDCPLSGMTEFDELREKLAHAPSGAIDWSPIRKRFAHRWKQLAARHPALAEFESIFRSLPDHYLLYRAQDGTIHVAERTTNGRHRWPVGILNLPAVLEQIRCPRDPAVVFTPPLVICGDWLGLAFAKIFNETRDVFMTYAPRIYCVEPDPAVMGLALYLADDIAPWRHERVDLFTGPACFERFEKCLKGRLERSPPDTCIKLPFAASEPAREVIDVVRRVIVYHDEQSRSKISNLSAYCNSVGDGEWARHLSRPFDRPPRVLGMTSRFTTVLQHSMRDLKTAFERIGCEFRTLIEPNNHDLPTTAASATVLDAYRPDLIVVIDHLRREYAHVMPAGAPFVCWVQDMLPNLACPEAGRSIGPRDFFIAPDPQELIHYYEYPAANALCWSFATNTGLYREDLRDEAALAAHRCDISFVSNQSTPPEEFHRRFLQTQRSGSTLARVVEFVYETVRRDFDDALAAPRIRSAGEILEEVRASLGVVASSVPLRDRLSRTYIHPISELFFRQCALGWAADFCERTGRTLNLYGNGWERHPRLSRYARGVADNGETLRAIYQASTINLQIIGTGAVHPRLLDGLASGGFFLIRRCPFDTLHHAAGRFVKFVEGHGVEPDRPYEGNAVDELRDIMRQLAPLIGVRPMEAALTVTTADIHGARGLIDPGNCRVAGALFADYDDVAFKSRDELASKAARYLEDVDARRRIAQRMSSVVRERLSYDALVAALLEFTSARLRENARSNSSGAGS